MSPDRRPARDRPDQDAGKRVDDNGDDEEREANLDQRTQIELDRRPR